MKFFYIPPHQNFFEELVLGAQAKFGTTAPLQYVVCSRIDDHTIRETISRFSKSADTIVNIANDDISSPWTLDIQLKLASVICSKFHHKQNPLSTQDVIALAPELLKLAIKCKQENISAENLGQMVIGNAPQHIEHTIAYLPDAIRVLAESEYSNAEQLGGHTQAPVLIVAPEQSSKSCIRKLKDLMEHYDSYIVLRPIDMTMTEDCWNQLDNIHPSFQQKMFLEQLGFRRHQIKCWNAYDEGESNVRSDFVSRLFYPASQVVEWTHIDASQFKALQGIEYVECRSIREEALVALIKAKDMLSETRNAVAIICDDDKMIKALLSLSHLFEVRLSVAEGFPMTEADHIAFLGLIFDTAHTRFAPTQLMALFKHKFFVLTEHESSSLVLLEKKYLRGLCKYDYLDELIELVKEEEIIELLQSLRTKFADLVMLMSHEMVEFSSLLSSIIAVASRCSGHEELYDALQVQSHDLRIGTTEFLSVLHRLIANHRVHAVERIKHQVEIISSSNSISCRYDNLIITGLNEGFAREDDWLLPIVSTFIGIENVETSQHRRARYLFSSLHRSRILLTRACMISGAPQVASRWLARLKLLEKKLELNLNASALIEKTAALYRPFEFLHYYAPAPTPELTPRMLKLSVTEVEHLMRDPYAVYAKHLLQLKPLDELDRTPTQSDFGQFIHSCINVFSKNYSNSLDDHQQLSQFNRHAEAIATRMVRKPTIRKLWMMRIAKIADWIINFERTRQGKRIYTEVKGSISMPLSDGVQFTLTCIADRIEIDEDEVTIIDFKTGAVPTDKDIASYMSPQLPLEAIILMHGGFADIEKTNALRLKRLAYIRLGAGSQFGKIVEIKGDLEKIVEEAKRGLQSLIQFYNAAGTPFAIAKLEPFSRYAHLERLSEAWQ